MGHTLVRIFAQISRRIYWRVMVYAALAVIAVILARLLEPFIPANLGDAIGAGSVDELLQTLSNSMLAVTTFSLTIMTSALARASSQWTPRSSLLLREDTVTHSVLGTFLGAYIFSVLSTVLRSAHYFNAQGDVVLFIFTIAVIGAVLLAMLRWVFHLEGLGGLLMTAQTIETETRVTLEQSAKLPFHGGHELRSLADIPPNCIAITAKTSGYVEQIFEQLLQSLADAVDAKVYLPVRVGDFLFEGDVKLWVETGVLDEHMATRMARTVSIAANRNYTQDPSFGVIALAEIATRALSPGINDPRTAIDILNRLGAIFPLAQPQGYHIPAPVYPRIHALKLDFAAMLEAAFYPIARYSGNAAEVHLALQTALSSISRRSSGDLPDAVQKLAARTLGLAVRAIDDQDAIVRIDQASPRLDRKASD